MVLIINNHAPVHHKTTRIKPIPDYRRRNSAIESQLVATPTTYSDSSQGFESLTISSSSNNIKTLSTISNRTVVTDSSWSSQSTSLSLRPKSTSTFGISTPDFSKITLPVLAKMETRSHASRYSEAVQTENKECSDTSSWTMETFTSTGLSSAADVIKVNYPWSPDSFTLGTDLTGSYPSSVTLVSQKGSRATVSSVNITLMPMNYIVFPLQEDNPFFDWISVKQEGFPDGYITATKKE